MYILLIDVIDNMKAKLQKQGNSLGARILSNILKSLNVKTNDILNIEQVNDKIVISIIEKHAIINPIISNNVFNENTKMVIVCSITSNNKEVPTHYHLEDTKEIEGAVLCEHIRSIDYAIRNIKFVVKLSDNDFISIITLLNACIEE